MEGTILGLVLPALFLLGSVVVAAPLGALLQGPAHVSAIRNADQPYHDKPFSCAMGATESGVLSLKRVASCCWTGVASIVCHVGMFGLTISELVDEHRYRCLTQPTTSIGADTAGAATT
jgi:hypothetical protein